MNSNIRRYAYVAVLLHALVGLVHGMPHSELEIPLTLFENAFIYIVITAAPIIAAILLWRGLLKPGYGLLFLSMTGSLLFGGYKHFIQMSPDHVSQIPEGTMGMIFKVTAVLLVPSALAGALVGAWGLRAISSTSKSA